MRSCWREQLTMFLKHVTENGFTFKGKHGYKSLWTKQFPTGREIARNKIIIETWGDASATYSHDEHGFRVCNDNHVFLTDSEIYCFGCSFTYGEGVDDHNTWPVVLGKKLGMKSRNFGIPGGSYDSITRTLMQILSSTPVEKLPRHVFILFPDFMRTEYIFNIEDEVYVRNFISNTYAKCYSHNSEQALPLMRSVFECNTVMTGFFNAVKNFRMIEFMLDTKGISWSWLSWSSIITDLPENILDAYFNKRTEIVNGKLNVLENDRQAADGKHPGPQYMDCISDQFVRLYRRQHDL